MYTVYFPLFVFFLFTVSLVIPSLYKWGFSGGSDRKESTCSARDQGSRPGLNPWGGRIPCRREWLATLVFLPEESHGESRLAGYSPWGRKKSIKYNRCNGERLYFLLCLPVNSW